MPEESLTFKNILTLIIEKKLDVKAVLDEFKLRNIDIKSVFDVYDEVRKNKVNVPLHVIIFFEKLKCATNVVYFMKKYVKIQHQDRGIILFDTFDFQDDTLKQLQENDRALILKSRQMGISTLMAAFSLWMMTFHEGKNILVLSIKQDTAKEVVTKVKLAWENLPSWLKLEALEKPALSLKLKNNSRILAASSDSDAARSFSASILILDEAAFIDNAEDVWTAAQQTLASTKGIAVILSTPNGVGNFFHQLWIDSERGKNTFHRIKLPWYLHPERNQTWRDRQTKELGPKRSSQECDCDFLTSGNTVVEMDVIEFYRISKVVEPIQKKGFDGNYWLWEFPAYTRSYIVSADVARGDGKDYSAFQVIDVETVTQVAEYVGKIPPKEFGIMCTLAAREWNNALLVIERETVGFAALQPAMDEQYPNLFYSNSDPTKYVDVQHQLKNKYYADERRLIPGFGTTMKTRPLIVSKLESYFRLREIEARSSRLIEELAVFIWDGQKPQAMTGYNDDLVISMCIGLWVRDTAMRLRTEGIDLTKMMLGNISRTVPNVMPVMQAKLRQSGFSQWNMRGPRGEAESIEWLIK